MALAAVMNITKLPFCVDVLMCFHQGVVWLVRQNVSLLQHIQEMC